MYIIYIHKILYKYNTYIGRQIDRQINRWIDIRYVDRQIDRFIDVWIDRQIERRTRFFFKRQTSLAVIYQSPERKPIREKWGRKSSEFHSIFRQSVYFMKSYIHISPPLIPILYDAFLEGVEFIGKTSCKPFTSAQRSLPQCI